MCFWVDLELQTCDGMENRWVVKRRKNYVRGVKERERGGEEREEETENRD